MTTGAKIGIGFGVVAAVSIIYFGFTKGGKAKWSSLMDPTKNGTKVPPRTNQTADDASAGVRNGADGSTLTPRKPGFGSAFGGSVLEAAGKKDGPNQKIANLKAQGLVTFADGSGITRY